MHQATVITQPTRKRINTREINKTTIIANQIVLVITSHYFSTMIQSFAKFLGVSSLSPSSSPTTSLITRETEGGEENQEIMLSSSSSAAAAPDGDNVNNHNYGSLLLPQNVVVSSSTTTNDTNTNDDQNSRQTSIDFNSSNKRGSSVLGASFNFTSSMVGKCLSMVIFYSYNCNGRSYRKY